MAGVWGNDTQFVGNVGVLGEKGVVVRVRSKWMLCILNPRVRVRVRVRVMTEDRILSLAVPGCPWLSLTVPDCP